MPDEVAALKARIVSLEGMVEILLRHRINELTPEEATIIGEDLRMDVHSGRHYRPAPRWDTVADRLNAVRQLGE